MLLNPEAAAAGESADSVAGLEADPAILSVVCFYLNAERQKRGRSTIDVGLVKLKTPEAIFDDYYRMAVSQVDPVAREFIETSLVTAGGERVLYPMRAVESQGSALAGAIKGLLDQGILRKEWFAGEQRLEISHDLLLGPIRQAVQDAKAAAARARSVRRRWQTAGAVVLGLLGTMALVLWRQSVFFERERRMDTLGQLIVALLPDDLPDDLEARFRISVNDLPEEARKLLDPATPNTEPVDVKNQVTWLVTVEPRVPDLQRLLQLTTGIKQAFDKSRRGPDLLMNTVQWVQAKVDRNNWQPAELASLESQLHGAVNELCRSDNMSPEDDAVTWFKTRSGIPPACRGQ
jgi:hypothetical protein